MVEEECEPCLLGVSIEVARHLCKITNSAGGAGKCEELYNKVVLGEMSINDYIDEIDKMVTDEDGKKTINEVRNILKEKLKQIK